MSRLHFQIVVGIFILIPRLIANFSTNYFAFNPFTEGQVGSHERRADEIANMFLTLDFSWAFTNTFDRWGLLLSPFWLLPGPSDLYAQVAMALVGTFAILNVYLIAEHYHSRQAGVFAIIPLALSPSYFFMHSIIQREAVILFGLTTAFVLVFLPNKRIRSPFNYVLAAGFVMIPAYLRFPNAPVILSVIVVTASVVILQSDLISFQRKVQSVIGVSAAGVVGTVVVIRTLLTDSPVRYLADLRERRIRGRATYLDEAVPASIPELIGFSWLGSLYFLFAPFPWHVERIDDLVIMLESMVGIGFSIFAILGALVLKERSVPATVALVSGIVLFSVLYGFGTGNYGTGLRHRQTIFWAIFVLGAIGFSSKVKFKI